MALYLVTGGDGFIGSYIVDELMRRGEGVRVLDNFSTGRRENLDIGRAAWKLEAGRLEVVEGDIRDLAVVRQTMTGVDYVLHQAALPSVQRSVQDPLTTNEVNVTGTLHVLQAAREVGVKRVVMASSSSVYGDSPTLPKHEAMPTAPRSPYAVSKLAAERYALAFHTVYGLPTVALRYFNVFGPRQDPTSQYSAVIPMFITAMLKGEAPTIYGDGLQSLLDLQRELAQIIGSQVEPRLVAARPGDVKHSLAAIELAREKLGYEPEVKWGEGLRRTVGWYQMVGRSIFD